MTAGKRRTAREMAIQMLYQSDLGGSPLSNIFSAFDLADHLARKSETRRGKGARAKAPSADGADAAAGAAGGSRETAGDPTRHKRRVEDAFLYAQQLVRGTIDHREEIDAMIRGQADNWRLERMPAVDRNILRLAIYEMLYERETPKLVVVDEAIELAKKFGSEQSSRFVNGLLDGLLKQHTFPGTLT
ncbi:MAG TPA: transcription antitermination factor NusB [Thermoanaerobaculia bacterium]|nr:transcription antitermination factor NusB [Thermoanaerobaculia bacterium]